MSAWFVPPTLRGYHTSWLGADALAGLSLVAVALPSQMATARLAGVPAAAGLYAFVAGSVLYALFGTNRRLSVGADSTIAPVLAVGVASIAVVGTSRYLTTMAFAALLVGGLLPRAVGGPPRRRRRLSPRVDRRVPLDAGDHGRPRRDRRRDHRPPDSGHPRAGGRGDEHDRSRASSARPGKPHERLVGGYRRRRARADRRRPADRSSPPRRAARSGAVDRRGRCVRPGYPPRRGDPRHHPWRAAPRRTARRVLDGAPPAPRSR